MNRILFAALVVVAIVLGAFTFVGWSKPVAMTPPAVTDVKDDGTVYGARTELCTDNGVIMRDWIFSNRWMKKQLTHDTYIVDGRTYRALRIVTNDPTLPARHVRFRKETVNVGSGPTLEGHTYLRTLINGSAARIEREVLFVEFNGRLERQRRPLPPCGTPRS